MVQPSRTGPLRSMKQGPERTGRAAMTTAAMITAIAAISTTPIATIKTDIDICENRVKSSGSPGLFLLWPIVFPKPLANPAPHRSHLYMLALRYGSEILKGILMITGSFIDNLLFTPSYGWKDRVGGLIVSTSKQLWSEALSRINIFRSRRNWISFVSFLMLIGMLPFFFLFFFKYFSWYLLAAIVIYSMAIMGTHGTIWFHRYCTHKSYGFS